MGLKCTFKGHDWNGCVCKSCGAKRDAGHDFQPTEFKSTYICSRCGREYCKVDTLVPADIDALRKLVNLPQVAGTSFQRPLAEQLKELREHLMQAEVRLCLQDIVVLSTIFSIAQRLYSANGQKLELHRLIVALNKLCFFANDMAGQPEKTVFLIDNTGIVDEPAPAQPQMRGWIFSLYDHDRVQSLSMFDNGRRYYSEDNILKMVRDWMKLPAGAVELSYIPAPDWDAPNVTATESSFDCDIDVIYSKAMSYMIDRGLCERARAAASIKQNMPYPNAGLLLVVCLIAL